MAWGGALLVFLAALVHMFNEWYIWLPIFMLLYVVIGLIKYIFFDNF